METIENNSPWIPHDGGGCPIPWAQKEDFGFETERVRHNVSHNQAVALDWSKVVAWRLTNRWLPVIDGTCSDSLGWKADEWEWRDKKGVITKGIVDITSKKWCVAVRRIKPVVTHDWECVAISAKPSPSSKEDFRPKPHQNNQQDLAYHRFRSSPRGLSALAQIGKATGPQFRPLGEDAMLNLFSAALAQFESEIERKRG